ncbi:opine metallophore biosynthesis dehydrogenase, partial [Staphylococcus aureus]|uniref:opine metallophore biosynthesis dehydrogenase n=1 Tax=Staphylococcus aureus TaxID=1280 RepID=UPI00119D94FC
LKPQYQALVIPSTAHAYYHTLHQFSLQTFQTLKHLILISPTFPSQIILQQFISNFTHHIQLISFSTYLPHTPILHKQPPNHLLTT